MEVYIRDGDFGNTFDVYFIQTGFNERRILRPLVTEEGMFAWTTTPLAEGVVESGPTLQLDREMLDALKKALKDSKIDADEELVRRLRLEEDRVDKLMDYVLAQPIIIAESTKVAYTNGGTE